MLDASVIGVLLGQRAKEALDGAGHVDVHVGDVGLLEVGQAREPALGVDDVDVAHELDDFDLAALVERVVVPVISTNHGSSHQRSETQRW